MTGYDQDVPGPAAGSRGDPGTGDEGGTGSQQACAAPLAGGADFAPPDSKALLDAARTIAELRRVLIAEADATRREGDRSRNAERERDVAVKALQMARSVLEDILGRLEPCGNGWVRMTLAQDEDVARWREDGGLG